MPRQIFVLLLIFCAVLNPARLFSDSRNSQQTTLLLNARLGLELGVSASAFFKEYRRLTQMPTGSFESPLCYAVAAKYHRGSWNIGVEAEYFSTSVGDNGSMTVFNPMDSSTIMRQMQESISLNAFPIVASVEYTPFDAEQFRNYVGLGAGVALVHTVWTEQATSQVLTDQRRGGTFLDHKSIVPAFRAYTGLELGFDSHGTESATALLIELRFSYSENVLYPFAQLQKQESYIRNVQNGQFSMGISSISLMLGVQFSFARQHR